MTRQAVVVRRKMDMPTAVVAMLGTESLRLPSEFTLGPSEGTKVPLMVEGHSKELPLRFRKGSTGFFQFHKRQNVLCLHF